MNVPRRSLDTPPPSAPTYAPCVHFSSSNVDATIHSRLRSLMASRNETRPQRVPLFTPDSSHAPQGFEQDEQGYFGITGDLKKRLSVLEPPERRYSLINSRLRGSREGINSFRRVVPGLGLVSCKEDQVLGRSQTIDGHGPSRRVSVDGSDDLAGPDQFHPRVRPQNESSRLQDSDCFIPETIPWEYSATKPSDSRLTNDAIPHLHPQNDRSSAPSRNSGDDLAVTLQKMRPAHRKIFTHHQLLNDPHTTQSPGGSTSSSPVPPMLTRGGEHGHDHGKSDPWHLLIHPNVLLECERPSDTGYKKHAETGEQSNQRRKGHDDKYPPPKRNPSPEKDTTTQDDNTDTGEESKLSTSKVEDNDLNTGEKSYASTPRLNSMLQLSRQTGVQSPLSEENNSNPESSPTSRTKAESTASWMSTEAGQQWLSQVINSKESIISYRTELTERTSHRAQTQGPLEADLDDKVSEGGPGSSASQGTTANAQGPIFGPFNKVITDLEKLLSEALLIAHHAAEFDEPGRASKDIAGRKTVPDDRRRSMAPPRIRVTFEEPGSNDQYRGNVRKSRADTPYSGTAPGSRRPLARQKSDDLGSTSTSSCTEPDAPGDVIVPLELHHFPPQDNVLADISNPSTTRRRKPMPPPIIQPRSSSLGLRRVDPQPMPTFRRGSTRSKNGVPTDPNDDGEGLESVQFPDINGQDDSFEVRGRFGPRATHQGHHASLKSHIRGFSGESLESDEQRHGGRQAVARDWCTSRKRITAAIACLNTALLGFLIGIYAGEVPAIQYAIVDLHHYAILGNVFFYIGLAIPTLLCWPLPILHGRRPYTLSALVILLSLQLPQGIAVGHPLARHVAKYRVLLLVCRGLSGLAMGFANMNFQFTLLDLFGASLQSANPHQEVIIEHDLRRQGGGMGVWLGVWSCCSIGSISVGFLIGAGIVQTQSVTWGFWISVILTMFMLLINVIAPEVRRSRHRRSLAEVSKGSRRGHNVHKGEITVHLKSTGASSFVEELISGLELSLRLLKQPGFFILCMYTAWVYGQFILIVVLLGALISRDYKYKPVWVGLCVLALAIGALLAVPFQKASVFSRSRIHTGRTDSMTFERRITKSSHLLRRLSFMVLLPLADLAYTVSTVGPPLHCAVPTAFAAIIGFLSNMAIAECNGLIMETFDTSDLQAGMIGRPRKRSVADEIKKLRTPFTCYPRISSAFALCQGFGFLIAAAATGTGGALERRLGDQTATGVVAGILLILTVLLTVALWRFKVVTILPDTLQRAGTSWEAVVIGQPSGKTRRMSLLELGKQSRWTEIRRRNRLTFSE